VSRYAPFILPLLVLLGLLFAVSVIAFSLRGRPPGIRLRGILLVPLALALLLLGVELILMWSQVVNAVGRVFDAQLVAGSQFGLPAEWSYILAAAMVVAAAVASYLAVDALPGFIARLRAVRRRGAVLRARAADATRAVLVGLIGAAVLTGVSLTERQLNPSQQSTLLNVVARHELPGAPTGIALADDRSGYIALGQGQILRFELSEDLRAVTFETAVDGLVYPRGLAIVEDRLFVVDLGPLPCDVPFPQCWFSTPEEELELLNASSATLLAFPIDADGALGDPAAVIEGLPVVNSEHAPNGLIEGPDGFLYMSVGNVDRMPMSPERIGQISQPHREWLGTVLRFRPDGSELTIFARGVRNVFDLAFDPEGRLYGADNDGITERGLWLEQLYEVRDGVDFGYPTLGTFDAGRDPDADPLALLPAGGSAAVEWAEAAGLPPGVLVGSIRQLGWVPLSTDDRGPYVTDERGYISVLQVDGFVTGLAATEQRRLLATVFSQRTGLPSSLVILEPGP
jgi:hypothetical protein